MSCGHNGRFHKGERNKDYGVFRIGVCNDVADVFRRIQVRGAEGQAGQGLLAYGDHGGDNFYADHGRLQTYPCICDAAYAVHACHNRAVRQKERDACDHACRGACHTVLCVFGAAVRHKSYRDGGDLQLSYGAYRQLLCAQDSNFY